MSNLYYVDFSNKKLLSKEQKEPEEVTTITIREQMVCDTMKASLANIMVECLRMSDKLKEWEGGKVSFSDFYLDNMMGYYLSSVTLAAQILDNADFEMERILNDKEIDGYGEYHGFILE